MIPVEICIDCSNLDAALASASAAKEGGASRIECCAHMESGGLTPEVEIVKQIVEAVGMEVEILVMIRPREGNFDYSPAEILQMLESISSMAAAGAHGVVLGAVRDGTVDGRNLETLTLRATDCNLSITFHRAYDALSDPAKAIEALKAMDIDRILTSGMTWGDASSALFGIRGLNQTLSKAGDAVEIVVGGGISAGNASAIQNQLIAEGKRSFHAFSSVLKDALTDTALVADLVRNLNE